VIAPKLNLVCEGLLKETNDLVRNPLLAPHVGQTVIIVSDVAVSKPAEKHCDFIVVVLNYEIANFCVCGREHNLTCTDDFLGSIAKAGLESWKQPLRDHVRLLG